MELRDFAQQVLFADSLEEKLRPPEAITDLHPGAALPVPGLPGRPKTLRFKTARSSKGELPSVQRLGEAGERGRWLHFFANHELLATELMALVLLRFPQAPAAFRRGVLQTLKDEQEHTRLYIERLRQCGIPFGQFPVSGYFWRAISGMENPLDYVSGLSLTFEQANLDFAAHFARLFREVGDGDTARLLDRIYRDEIGHVAYGLKWFRRWKDPRQSDWEAFCRQLRFPLSPRRAKGLIFNAAGRQAAGFEPEFIGELEVFSQSKGRTPSVFLFNPFAEGYLAQGKSFTPVKEQLSLARDLENLPQFLCGHDDIVLVQKRPSIEFLRQLKQAGFELPEFSQLQAGAVENSLSQRKLGRLQPWAWGPDSLERLAPLFGSVTGENRRPEQRFNPAIAALYSKAWSSAFLAKLLRGQSGKSWLCTEAEVGVAVQTPEDCWRAIEAIRRRGHHKIIVKEALGLAGHNAIRLWEPQLLEAHRRWITRALENRRLLVVEPWLERAADFSIQLDMGPGGLKLCGYTGLINDLKGQFEANSAAPNFRQRLPANVLELWPGKLEVPGKIYSLYAEIFHLLETELQQAEYFGPINIDAFVYRAPGGECRLKPIVEINPRYTMGRLTLELMNHVCPGSQGLFRLVKRATLAREGFDNFPAYASALSRRFPLVLEGEPAQKIREGALCLNDPTKAEVCLAVFEVTRAGAKAA